MNLRGRTIEPLERIRSELKNEKVKPCRRSVRNKTPSKSESTIPPKPNDKKTSVKESRPRPKRRSSKKTRTKSELAEFSQPFFPPIEETGLRDVLEECKEIPHEDSHLVNEALVIYECKACNSFFRTLVAYLRHKQNTCTSLVVKTKSSPDNWNPFLSKDVFSLFPTEDDSDD